VGSNPTSSVNFYESPCNARVVETCFWPVYEIINGQYRINYKPKQKLPVQEYLLKQGRFKHLFESRNAALLEEIQATVDARCDRLLKLESID
jgi:pyruvate ferredoxin oxidoreductase beta subunit